MGQHDHLYNSRAWRARRARQLQASPLCEMCAKYGRVVLATIADHVEPHRGDHVLFQGRLQSLCKLCHDSTKARIEAGKEPRPVFGEDGFVIEPNDS